MEAWATVGITPQSNFFGDFPQNHFDGTFEDKEDEGALEDTGPDEEDDYGADQDPNSTIRGLVDPNIFHYAGHPPLQGWSHGNEPAPLLSTLPAIQTSTQPHTLYGFPPFPHSHHEGGAGPHVQPPPPAQAASPQHISQFSVTAGASSQLPPTAGISADELNCRLTTQTFVVSYITNCTKL